MQDGKFMGAMEVYIDVTDLLAWYSGLSHRVSVALGAAVALIFLIVGTLVWSFAKERANNARSLIAARDAALKSEAEAKNLSRQLKESNSDIARLNRELKEHLKKLSEAQAEIIRRGKLAQLGKLTATVAHEIRNPLGSARTAAFLIERKLKKDNPALEIPLQRITTGIKRCNTIITELLDFARANELQLQSLDFDAWLTDVVNEQAANMPNEIDVQLELGLHQHVLEFDADRMHRDIVNFMTNAAEAMIGKEACRNEDPTPNPKLIIKTALTERGIEVSAIDNGPGINEELLERILEPLFTTKHYGVGLGLPAVEKIFEQHGGGMEIKSTVGEGATFTGWFPMDRVAPPSLVA